MKKIVQDKDGLHEVDSNVNLEYFNSEEFVYYKIVNDKDKLDFIAKYLNLK